jgi:nucleotide-binding universal stress UspA family protein
MSGAGGRTLLAMTVVCGTDLSEGAGPAVEAAAALAARLGDSSLALVHAVERGGSEEPGAFDARRTTAAALLAAEADAIGRRYALGPVRRRLVEGPAAEVLARLAEEEGAALLVVSSRGHGAAPLHKLGGTSERVAVECHLPVLVVRDARPFAAWARGERRLRIVLGIDWTETTDRPIQLVRSLRAAAPADVVVVHVYFPGVSSRWGLEPLGPSNEPGGSLDQLVARDMALRVGELGGRGEVAFRPLLGLERIGDHVLEAASAEHADVVVVGTHARRGYRRLAAVSSVVLHGSRTSVCCVPRVGAIGAG